jgi:hypothetical protein
MKVAVDNPPTPAKLQVVFMALRPRGLSLDTTSRGGMIMA